MAQKKVADRSGKTLSLVEFEGGMYPEFPVESMKNVSHFSARPDDVLICSYPKCGTHWSFEIIRFLIAGTTDIPVKDKMDVMIEDASPAALDALPSPRQLNTHFLPDMLSPDVFRQRSKILYVTRDPRDVAVSFFNHHRAFPVYEYDGEWKDYFFLYLEGQVDYGSWFEYTIEWEKFIKNHPDHPVLVLSYEDMLKEPLQAIRKVAEFIGVKASEELLQKVTEKTAFKSMTSRRENVETKSSKYVYRKGKSGDWKNWFTVAQLEMFNEAFEEKMPGTDAYELYSHANRKEV